MRWIRCFLLSFSAAILISGLLFAADKPAPGVHPIVDVQTGWLFGGSVDGQWLGPDEVKGKLILKVVGGEQYRLYSNSVFLGMATGGKPIYQPALPAVNARRRPGGAG